VRAAKKRVCDGVVANTDRTDVPDNHWAGNIANQETSGQTYTEIDVDYYVPCVSGYVDSTYDESEWIGLGGGFIGGDYTNPPVNYDQGPLVQTGTDIVVNGGVQY
jgi:hypothetical protein